jgi:hypothetical protein
VAEPSKILDIRFLIIGFLPSSLPGLRTFHNFNRLRCSLRDRELLA